MSNEQISTKISILLYHLGITPDYTGFFQTAWAVQLSINQPERRLFVTKWLYPEVAKRCCTTATAVDRNIRTVIKLAWERNPDLISALAGYPIQDRPRPAQFIGILSAALLKEESSAPVI